jgi:glycosyltransferase involved in cell wall biosynthesis
VSRVLHQAAPSAGRAPGLTAFRNIHQGETIVVCGCGESLKELTRPQGFVTVGVNDVGRLFDPSYLVVVNPRNQFKGDRFRYVEQSNAQALFTQLDLAPVRPPVVRFKLGQYGGTEIGAANVLHYTQNSPYVAVCLAAYMGARRIGLIGVDLTDDHFFARTGRHPLAGRLREIDTQYGRLAAALEKHGVELLNLSSASRLTSLRRARVEEDGSRTKLSAVRAVAAAALAPAPQSGTISMKVAIERRSVGVIGQFLDAFATSIAQLGHAVVRDPRTTALDPSVLSIVWNGRGHQARGPTLYCEHGWLPRSDYQVSPAGINAGSHLSPFAWNGSPLSREESAALDAHLAAIKSACFSGYQQYMQAGGDAVANLPPAFLLVPLQIETDTNIIRHAPAHLRTMQALIDYTARLDPPWPVIFKQHPADPRHGDRHLRLRMRRRQDLLWPHARGNIHQMLKSGACRGILTINSNVAHDGLLWDVPAIVLGRNVWPTSGARLPFLASVPRDWSALAESATSVEGIACRRAYAHFLIKNQWTLADARDPRKVAALLAGVRGHVPTAAARAKPPKLAAVRPRAGPMINVVAENRGWLFEAWKQRLAAAHQPGCEIVASNRPLREADAWIFIRAREAGTTPDPARTVVQLHDLNGDYGRGGERACVANCAAVSLTHPRQQELLAADGVDLAARRWILQPVGWSVPAELAVPRDEMPALAWVGRPARSADADELAWFIEAVRGLHTPARIALVGERLDSAAAALKRLGTECRVYGHGFPLLRATEWIGRFDCVMVGGTGDSGPWPIFDALYAGTPVVAASCGWAGSLLADGTCGRLVSGAPSLRVALDEVLATHATWRTRRTLIRARVAELSLSAWAQANLRLAADLVRPAVRQAA